MKYRQLLRFRLRTLLILFAILSIWLAIHVISTRRQEEAAIAIREYGGWVRYDFQYPSGQFSHKDFDSTAKSWVPKWALNEFGFDFFHDIVFVSLNYSEDSGKREENDNLSDDALRHLPGLPNLRILLLSDTQATDKSMLHLEQLTNLEYLYMWDASEVSNEGTAYLRHLKKLKYVHLSKSQITDESLRIFGDLPMIEGLSLQFNFFSDAGLHHLHKLQNLKTLTLCGRENKTNAITDHGLEIIAIQHNLSLLGVQNTEVTGLGLTSFRESFPKCKIWD